MSKNLHPEGVGVFAHFIRQDADRRSAIRSDPAFSQNNVFSVRILLLEKFDSSSTTLQHSSYPH
ncbi:hypothetical protein PRIO_2167 [Paenibacillus riograndensis SBR5]|uniref:Uncharacterized protein n=1 Tax=Paenibacillus riograndensis SBR5 TaxID=1073571 RepID=A0A0E4CVU9_9BACL|nr:hypothetical protein PRIO_2167 [Paenibacillus riograndensis SBR5]